MHLSLTLDCQSLRRKTEVITQQLRNLQCTEVSEASSRVSPAPLQARFRSDNVHGARHSCSYIIREFPFRYVHRPVKDEDQGAAVQCDPGAVSLPGQPYSAQSELERAAGEGSR